MDDVWQLFAKPSSGQSASGPPDQGGTEFLRSCLSGPVDVDKMDYLQRDSLHAGVPYGRNFDAERLTAAMRFAPRNARGLPWVRKDARPPS